MRKKTKHEFIADAIVVHGAYYSYAKSNYKGSTTKLRIDCPEHGPFWQTPAAHIHQKSGCPKCRGRSLKIQRGRLPHAERQDAVAFLAAKLVAYSHSLGITKQQLLQEVIDYLKS